MNKENDSIERFKNALKSTVKALSGSSDLEIKFGEKLPKEKNSICLPDTKDLINDHLYIRALADSEALKIKYTNKNTYLKNLPNNKIAKDLYISAEKIRYEKIGSDRLKGVKKNIVKSYEEKMSKIDFESLKKDNDGFISASFEYYLRNYLFELKSNPIKTKFKKWLNIFDKKIKHDLPNLKKNLHSQDEFSKVIKKIMNDLELLGKAENTEDKENSNPLENKDNSLDQNKNENQSLNQEIDEKNNEISSEIPMSNVNFEKNNEDENQVDIKDSKDSNISYAHNKNNLSKENEYKIFTEKFDEIEKVENLETNDEILRLRKNLDQQLQSLKNIVSKLANKLQRQLLAKQNRSWEFDLEEGMLDSSKLTRIIIDPYHALSFKREKNIEFKDTVVTLLIDNSGSMRGRPITIAALCADILSRTLEKCSVKVEILGFTTKNWKGGKSREKWNEANKPSKPGRLNDLRHIIYKSADAPWRQVKKNLGLMLKEGILKENIDGEAITWAFQ